jgi:prolyl-tRNA editing enzyme YbaK/EbsC (Cys-tRNA(Pro) deacylase)
MMSVEKVKNYLARYGMEKRLHEFPVSSATVELAARALGVEAARIAKSISFHDSADGCLIIVTTGDVKIDNPKFKAEFGFKAKMLNCDDVERLTGYRVGGVCPFDNPPVAKVYCDVSLKRFDRIFPAGGTDNSCVELTCDELFRVSNSVKWVDVCKSREVSKPV